MDALTPSPKDRLLKLTRDSGELFEASEAGRPTNPYRLLPHSDWIDPVKWYLRMTEKQFIPDPIAFCARLTMYAISDGLTLEELQIVLWRMLSAAIRKKLKYETDHSLELADLVEQAKRVRRDRKEQADRDAKEKEYQAEVAAQAARAKLENNCPEQVVNLINNVAEGLGVNRE